MLLLTKYKLNDEIILGNFYKNSSKKRAVDSIITCTSRFLALTETLKVPNELGGGAIGSILNPEAVDEWAIKDFSRGFFNSDVLINPRLIIERTLECAFEISKPFNKQALIAASSRCDGPWR